MSDSGLSGVVGTDGIIPIYQPDARWTLWSIDELYNGGVGDHKFIPKVKDYAIDPDTFTTYVVDHIDPITLIPTLREIRPANMSYIIPDADLLLGVLPGPQSDTYRIYIDKSVTPYTLAVDARFKVGGSAASYAKIFRGSSLSDAQSVVSKIYDTNGQVISENVPLELIVIDSHINYTAKTIAVCNTTDDLIDREIVTAVIYTAEGSVVSKRQFLVENTSYIRSLNSSVKYITSIYMECLFLSDTADKTIDFPLNIPLSALNLLGVVSYSDGTTLKLPVNGGKFKIYGLDQFISSIPGQKIELVLNYSLSNDEISYVGNNTNTKFISAAYSLVTVNPNNSYAVKLFGYPIWINESQGYRMKWWLYNLDRNLAIEVTEHVLYSDTTGPYDPKGYGFIQRKAVSLNLQDISNSFKPFIHTQIVEIVLNTRPDNTDTPWTMAQELSGNTVRYGSRLYAKRVSNDYINISSGINIFADWIAQVYRASGPIINRAIEIEAPTPTHFVVTYGATVVEYPISAWGSNIALANSVLYDSISIRFIKRLSSSDLELSIAVLVIKP